MPTSNAERQRRWRARQRSQPAPAQPILFQIDDWQEFVDRRTLPRKAGCEPRQIGGVIIKELTDNGLDSGADSVTLTGNGHQITVSDNGPGLDRDTILRVFVVNRPLLSSKRQRLPTRGMLGNGLRVVMGAVAAYGGTISVTSDGRTYDLAVDTITGGTRLTAERMAAPQPGLSVTVTFAQPMFDGLDRDNGQMAIELAQIAERTYTGLSQPSWYSPDALAQLMAAANVEPAQVIEQMFAITDPTAQATTVWTADFIARHPAPRHIDIGYLGQNALDGYYHKVNGHAVIDGATIPYCVEAWVNAERAEQGHDTSGQKHLLLNRSPTLARLNYHSNRGGIWLTGCGLDVKAKTSRARYDIHLSVITPNVQLMNDGKTPYLGPFRQAVETAVSRAARGAYNALTRPPTRMTVKAAAYQVMREAYMKASGNGQLPVQARQIMYAARPLILALTGKEKFGDGYFTQTLLPDYVREHPDETADWDVIYDARGHASEPHTGRVIPLGTVEVRDYLGLRPRKADRPRVAQELLYPTVGPKNRYRNAFFVEKEGFDELWAAVRLRDRYDLLLLSTKGMSNVAARHLLDAVSPLVDNILVLHDFDVSGFSIGGTLGTDSRRYEFDNDLSDKLIDIGLRLTDVHAMNLQSEPQPFDDREARRHTLLARGATDAEVEFLLPDDDDAECRRVELNAMTSPQLVAFVEAALVAHGVEKVIPERAVLEQHARHLRQAKLASDLIAARADEIAAQAAAMTLPDDLADQIAARLAAKPTLSWDQALAALAAPNPPPTGRFGFRRGN